jgi:hypothetical protein
MIEFIAIGFVVGLGTAYTGVKCYGRTKRPSTTAYWFSQLRPQTYTPVTGDEELV